MPDYSRPNAQLLEDGTLVVRASALGMCPVSLVWDIQHQMGQLDESPSPPPPQMQEAMDDSSSLESQAIDLLRDKLNVDISEGEHTVIGLVGDDMRVAITGTPDAMNDDMVYEIKCMSTGTYEQFVAGDVWEKYLIQCGAYQFLTDKPVTLAVFEKQDGGLTGEMYLHRVDDIWSVMAQERAEHLLQYDLSQEYDCTGNSDWCPWADKHTRPHLSVDATRWFHEWKAHDKAAKESAALADEFKQKVIAEVREKGGKCAITTTDGEVKLTWVETHVVEEKPREYDRKYLNVSKPKK